MLANSLETELLLKYLARVRTRATPLLLSTPSTFLQAPTSTIASVASPRGAWSIAYMFSPEYVSPALLYSYFCRATLRPEALKNSSSLSFTLKKIQPRLTFMLSRPHTRYCPSPPKHQPPAYSPRRHSDHSQQNMYGPAPAAARFQRYMFSASNCREAEPAAMRRR